jgi:hypothetical protein
LGKRWRNGWSGTGNEEIDVFERAKQGHAAVPQRTSDTANARTLQEFNELKYKSK